MRHDDVCELGVTKLICLCRRKVATNGPPWRIVAILASKDPQFVATSSNFTWYSAPLLSERTRLRVPLHWHVAVLRMVESVALSLRYYCTIPRGINQFHQSCLGTPFCSAHTVVRSPGTLSGTILDRAKHLHQQTLQRMDNLVVRKAADRSTFVMTR